MNDGAGTIVAEGQAAISSETVTLETRYMEERASIAIIPAKLIVNIMFRNSVYCLLSMSSNYSDSY